jgi:tight adherence protein C
VLFVSPLLIIGIAITIDGVRDHLVSIYSGEVLKKRKKAELHQLEREFPSIVELFAILVSAGQSPSAALLRISDIGNGTFANLLRDCVHEMRHGASLSAALEMMNEIAPSSMIRRFNDSILIALDRGTQLNDVLYRQVEEVRQVQRTGMLERAGKAEIALMIPVVFLILPVSVLFALWPSYFALGNSIGF